MLWYLAAMNHMLHATTHKLSTSVQNPCGLKDTVVLRIVTAPYTNASQVSLAYCLGCAQLTPLTCMKATAAGRGGDLRSGDRACGPDAARPCGAGRTSLVLPGMCT